VWLVMLTYWVEIEVTIGGWKVWSVAATLLSAQKTLE